MSTGDKCMVIITLCSVGIVALFLLLAGLADYSNAVTAREWEAEYLRREACHGNAESCQRAHVDSTAHSA